MIIVKKPKIRFKGFTETWEQRKLDKIFISLQNNTLSRSDLSNQEGIAYDIHYGDVLIKFNDVLNFSNEKIPMIKNINALKKFKSSHLQNGDIVVADTAEDETVGKCCEIQGITDEIVISGLHTIPYRPLIKFGDGYLGYYLNSNSYHHQLLPLMQGIKVTSISKSSLKDTSVLFPKQITEQEKIGSIFSKLDNLITLHQRKCENLKKLKKFMLQKMFPQNGENVPKIRFSNYTDTWEQRKFGEIVIIERGGSPRPIDKFITDDESGLNWVKIGDAPKSGNYITNTKEKIITEGLSKTREVYPGDLILSNSMSFGKPYIMGIKGCIHDGWLLIRDSNNEFDLMYLCYMLGTDTMLYQYKAMAAGSTVNNLNKELVGNTYVKYPSMLEQEQIGSFFSKLDHLITLHQSKCDNLKEVKKYILQNMFI